MRQQSLLGGNSTKKGYTIEHIENIEYIPHIHSSIEMVCVLEGRQSMQVGNEHYILKPGDICLVTGFRPHSYYAPENSRCFGFGISPEAAGQFVEELGNRRLVTPVFPQGSYSPDITGLIQKMLDNTPFFQPRQVSIAFLNVILGHLFSIAEFAPAPEETDPVEVVLTYLHGNCRRPLGLESAAEDLGMSKFQLSRICSQKIGLSFSDYVKFLRIATAKRMLVYTDASVSQIAGTCGFESVRTFNRSFLDVMNVTPKEFRTSRKHEKGFDMSVQSYAPSSPIPHSPGFMV